MASLNTSHHQDGGVLLYNGELVLLYCDKVNCDIENVGNSNGRLFLTTHRIVFTSQPINQNPRLMSLAAPFYAMFDLGLEQPVFGANYIKGKVRTNSSQNTSALTQNQYIFKLKFNKGGAIEFGRALTLAAKQASSIAQQTGWSNTYTFSNTPASQYYQAPSDVYQPNYPVGFVLPHQVFNEVPEGQIYYSQAPPPYPGLVTAHQAQQPNPYAQMYPVGNPTMNSNFGGNFGNPVYESNQSYNPYGGNQSVVSNPNFNVYPTPPAPPQHQQNQYGYQRFDNPTNPNQPPPAYSPNQNPYQQPPPQHQVGGYMPPNTNSSYQQQYPTPPQAGYMPQSNSTYPNLPNYNSSPVKKEK